MSQFEAVLRRGLTFEGRLTMMGYGASVEKNICRIKFPDRS